MQGEYILNKPVKKMDVYVSELMKSNTNSVKIKIPYCVFIAIHNIKNGKVIRFFYDDEHIKELDEFVLKEVIHNNQKWFNNDLNEEQIQDYYRSSYNLLNKTLDVLISEVRIPKIFKDNKEIDNLEDHIKNKDKVEIEIECQGVYFYNKKFGIRWFLKYINILSEEDDKDIVIDKNTINEEWSQQLNNIYESIQKDCEDFDKKKQKLIKFKKIIEEDINKAQTLSDEYDWNKQYFEITKKLNDYYNRNLDFII